jgi:hypothetical protein
MEESERSPYGRHSSEVAFLSPCLVVPFTPQLLWPSFLSLYHGTKRPGSEMLCVTLGSSLGHTSLHSRAHRHPLYSAHDRGSATNRSGLENTHGGTRAPRCVCQGLWCQGHFYQFQEVHIFHMFQCLWEGICLAGWGGVLTQTFQAMAAFPGDSGSILSSHLKTHHCRIVTPVPGDPMPHSDFVGTRHVVEDLAIEVVVHLV